ncbi:DoxX family membrane protein [Gloeobacter morelensis]|uniref:DoxX family membrane protein n=1 Tax=Gloeobacter morelensis MG652769 TaxID=2781736 RepID=A0ABY3PMN1_9CYAN|nr:DoxX family membrane protein [Gloeobacter morelensis]UFP94917.1 DoxX family membrane protein [Gloeobacter morelensis MG652769]
MNCATLDTTLTATRIVLGVFFVLSGMANYLHFYESGGLLETLLSAKLRLWGLGFGGIGPLPAWMALPYAYLLPAAEIAAGTLFALGRWTKFAGALMLLMLSSFILAFGLFPAAGLFPSNESTWDKNVFIMINVWICVVWEEVKVRAGGLPPAASWRRPTAGTSDR